jgi:hypothetical protein
LARWAGLGPVAALLAARERAVGIHQQFSEAGRLVRENHYNDKGGILRERAWDDSSGQLLRDDAVFEDGSRKAFAR